MSHGDYTTSFFNKTKLYYKPHVFHLSSVFLACRNYINTCRIDARMSQNIGKLCYILFKSVEHPCKQVSEIVRKHLIGRYVCFIAKPLHIPPDACAGDEFSPSGYENAA